MKKNMVLLVLGSLLCPMVLATAESVVDNRQSTLESKDELSITTSSEMPEFTEAIESSSSEVEEVERTILSTSSSEEESLEERIERILKEATTPEEYQEVLEYIKQTTDYNQVEKNDIDSYSFKSSVNRASQAKGVAEFLGISKQQLLNELQAHEYDNFYLGTPFRGLWTPSVQCMSPNGAPNRYGPGFNCTGFVATAFQRAGGDLRRITNVANAWGDVCNAYNWRDALRPNTEHYAFNSVNELLASGKAEKGDVIYFEPDYTAPNFDCHIGFFWGSRSNENLMWHSYDRNIKSNIKSATPFTKIYLFKLGNDKNAVIHDKKMNHKRFIEKTSASVYSRPYQSGDRSIDTTKGLYHQEVLVTREVRNGYGTWQEITYKNNNRTKKGWIQSGEMSDVINKASYKKRLAIRSNKADLYKDPYIPGVKTVSVLQNKKTLPVSISQKATTGYGEWYKVSFIDGKAERNGWMKSTDFAAIVNQQKIEKEVTVNKDYGAIYNVPYTGSVDDKQVDLTTELVNKEIPVLEEAYTGYGHWYRIDTTIDNVVYQGWIKETDVEDYIGYENVTGRMLINKNYGSVYDSPYVEGKTKQVDNLNGMLNEIVTISAKANTNKGTWYQVKYTKNKKTS
ncbi:MAG: GW dipeptide domain-containing protein, partial [Vagococcus sp.]